MRLVVQDGMIRAAKGEGSGIALFEVGGSPGQRRGSVFRAVVGHGKIELPKSFPTTHSYTLRGLLK